MSSTQIKIILNGIPVLKNIGPVNRVCLGLISLSLTSLIVCTCIALNSVILRWGFSL